MTWGGSEDPTCILLVCVGREGDLFVSEFEVI